jgi:predicted metal-dependent hydrolase
VVSPNKQGFSLHQGLIRRGSQVWIADNSALKTRIIAALHASAVGGHSRVKSTYQRVKRNFCWKGLKLDVESFVQQYGICQQAKHEWIHPPGLLQPLLVPQGA